MILREQCRALCWLASLCLAYTCSSMSIPSQDFLIMFVHHLATIGLITFSYINNMVRVGTLVLCLHDASDFLLEVRPQPLFPHYYSLSCLFFPYEILAFSSTQFLSSFLQAAKLANYAKYQRLCDTLFVIFSAVFMVTRLGIYPFW